MGKKELVFKGKLLKLVKERVRLPNGYVSDFEIIEHPGAALVIPLLTKNQVVMLKQLRPVINSYIYELPAGTLEKNERPLSCGKREIIEETGYKGKKFTRLGVIFPVPGYSTEKITIYKAEQLEKVERLIQEDEIIEHEIFTKAQIKELFVTGKIVDAKTISAFAMCGWL